MRALQAQTVSEKPISAISLSDRSYLQYYGFQGKSVVIVRGSMIEFFVKFIFQLLEELYTCINTPFHKSHINKSIDKFKK